MPAEIKWRIEGSTLTFSSPAMPTLSIFERPITVAKIQREN
jgi:hypothetical protein